jgi:threonine dehydrogenase-like Zn-dependent dehydrogenase
LTERLGLDKNKIGCDTIDFSMQKDVIKATYELKTEAVDCTINAAAFRYTKGLLQSAERAMGLETGSSEVVNDALRTVRKFGTIAVVVGYAAMNNQFLLGAFMEKGIVFRSTGKAPVQVCWRDLLKVESGGFHPTIILTHGFQINEFSEL